MICGTISELLSGGLHMSKEWPCYFLVAMIFFGGLARMMIICIRLTALVIGPDEAIKAKRPLV